MIIVLSFRSIFLLSMCKIFVFGMPEDKIWDIQSFCELTGIHNGTMVLFIWFKNITLVIKTKSFMKQPVSSLDIRK